MAFAPSIIRLFFFFYCFLKTQYLSNPFAGYNRFQSSVTFCRRDQQTFGRESMPAYLSNPLIYLVVLWIAQECRSTFLLPSSTPVWGSFHFISVLIFFLSLLFFKQGIDGGPGKKRRRTLAQRSDDVNVLECTGQIAGNRFLSTYVSSAKKRFSPLFFAVRTHFFLSSFQPNSANNKKIRRGRRRKK